MSHRTALLLASLSLLGDVTVSSSNDRPASGAGSDAARRIRGQRQVQSQPGEMVHQPGETAVTRTSPRP